MTRADNQPTAHQTRCIAVAACVDPRTVRRYLSGAPVRSTCAARIAEALCALGRELRQERAA